MLRRHKLKRGAEDASALALELARDRTFRKKLVSAIEHGTEARRRAGSGLAGAAGRLASDKAIRSELRRARDDLQAAYGRLRKKKKTHRLRNVLALLAGLAGLAAVPQVRERVAALVSKARPRQRDLDDLTRDELYARAQEADIPGRSEMTKEQLAEALRARS